MADNDWRHPAPPFYRTARPGRRSHRVQVGPPAEGKHVQNMSVPPIVHTNGKGERVLFATAAPTAVNPQVTDLTTTV